MPDAEKNAPWRLSDEDRVLWSESIPGHLWNAVRRMCECGAEVGVVCDKETVEQHLDAAATRVLPPAVHEHEDCGDVDCETCHPTAPIIVGELDPSIPTCVLPPGEGRA